MTNEEHYIPAIEDLFIGYEYEYRLNDIDKSDKWRKGIFGYYEDGDGSFKPTHDAIVIDIIYELENSLIRVPYLTDHQIEKEGWISQKQHTGHPPLYKNKSIYFRYYEKDHRMELYADNDDYCIFSGICKSINEFRKIIKMTTV